MESKITRRQMLQRCATTGALLSGGALSSAVWAQPSSPSPKAHWPYRTLVPATSAQLAYQGYYRGHCCYAVFYALVGQLAQQHGSPYDQFPFAMMKYGVGGVAGYGSLCGALNAAAAAIGLFYDDAPRNHLIVELFQWYEQTNLPRYQPSKPIHAVPIAATCAHSVLCHCSVAHWCQVSGHSASSPERAERCARLCADVARHTSQMLNAYQQGKLKLSGINAATQTCLACHGKGQEVDNAKTKMNCHTCHPDKQKNHPASKDD